MKRSQLLVSFAVSGLALFMVVLDNLVVTTALPAIRRDLGATLQQLEWTVNAYTLTYAVLLLLGAGLGDRFGRKRVFVAARREDFKRVDFHDLRHTFASLMIAAGANPLQLVEALGHSDQYGRPDPTLVWKRYGHLYPGSTREAAKALDRHLKAFAS